MADGFHPDLQRAARLIPRVNVTPRVLRVLRLLFRVLPLPRAPKAVAVADRHVPGPPGAPPVRPRSAV